MDYFVIINEQKKGPLDTITVIQRIHAGIITAQTLVSNSADGLFLPAGEHPELSQVFAGQEQTGASTKEYQKIDVRLGKAISDGLTLWSRYALSFTVISGIILALAFALSKVLSNVAIIGQFPFIGAYFVSLITCFLYLNFFGYILLAKRSQAVGGGAFMTQLKKGVGAEFGFAALLSLLIFTNAISPFIGLVAMLAFLIIGTFVAFVPFIIFDKGLGLASAVAKSIAIVSKGGAETISVVLALVALNIIVAIVPAIFAPQLFIFGLFISIPISFSSLAYIYDELSV